MLIENEFQVAAPTDEVWKHITDIPRVAPCLPGAELTQVVGDGSFNGRVTTKLGPVSLRFAGTARVVEQDDASKRMVLHATGSEEKGKGQANMNVTMTMSPIGSGTRVKVVQDLQLSGAAAQYGRGMIQDVTGVLMKQFATCLQEDLGAARRGEAPTEPRKAAAPAKGFSIWFQATTNALKRFFRRLMGSDFK